MNLQQLVIVPVAFLAMAVPQSPAFAQFGEPATLILEAHSDQKGVTDPVHTPDAAIHSALAWARVRHRVTIMTHADTEAGMKKRKENSIAGALNKINNKTERQRIGTLLNSINVVPYKSAEDARSQLDDWTTQHFSKPAQLRNGQQALACFGIVHILGHGATGNGNRPLLQIPTQGGPNEMLDIGDVLNVWQIKFIPVMVVLDCCRTNIDAAVSKHVVPIFPRRERIVFKNNYRDFIVNSRKLDVPIESNGDKVTTAYLAFPGEPAADCADLLSQRMGDGLETKTLGAQTLFPEHHRMDPKQKGKAFLTGHDIYEYASNRIKNGGMQPRSPYDYWGVLPKNHVVAIGNPQQPYLAPPEFFLNRWASAAATNNMEISGVADPNSEAFVITRKGMPVTNMSWVSANEANHAELELSKHTGSGRSLHLRVLATAGALDAVGAIDFEVQFSSRGAFQKRVPLTVAIGEVQGVRIDDIPESNALGISAIPDASGQQIAKTWPAGAQLHVLSMNFVDPRVPELPRANAPEIDSAKNWMQLWYYRHTLASDPASELSRVSTGNQSVLRFKISNLPKAAAGAFELIGPGGPLYAIRDVNKNDLLEIQLTPSKKFVGEFHVCVLDDKELPLLDEAVKKGLHRLKFVRPGKPSYLAILAKPAQEIKPGEGCEFVVEKCELKLSE